MAGDYVMIQHATPRKPEVLRLAGLLDVPPSHAFGLCVIAWMWFDEQTEDGHAFGVTVSLLDAIVSHVGFADALRQVGWLQVREGSLVVPNFARCMGHSAKKRAKDLARQRKSRHGSVTKLSRSECDKSVTKDKDKDKEKEKGKETPLPPELQSADFVSAWSAWIAHRQELKKPLRPTMAAEQLAMLARMGVPRAVAMIRHTIAMGWQGLREPESTGPPKGDTAKTKVRLADDAEGL